MAQRDNLTRSCYPVLKAAALKLAVKRLCLAKQSRIVLIARRLVRVRVEIGRKLHIVVRQIQCFAQARHCIVWGRAQVVLQYKEAMIGVFEGFGKCSDPIGQPVIWRSRIVDPGIKTWKLNGLVNTAKLEVAGFTFQLLYRLF